MSTGRSATFALLLIATITAAALSACSPQIGEVKPAPLRIGVLPTEDPLPLRLAQRDGSFKRAGLDVKIYTFQSVQDREIAFRAGAIDGSHNDLVGAALLRTHGDPVKVATLMLGATNVQGRFGLAVPPRSKVTSLGQLADVPIATSTGTIQDYVLDGLMSEAGIRHDRIRKLVVTKIPVRFDLLIAGRVNAAMLPEPLLSLAEQKGARVVADDTRGHNLSQTVLIFSEKYLDKPEGALAVEKLLAVWDLEVAKINADPYAYRGLLVREAGLPQPLARTYKVNTYPKHQQPAKPEVDRVLRWMKRDGLLPNPVTYSDLVWER